MITSDRVIFRHGVIAKSGIEIPLERVNSVHFNQSIIERMLGAGDLLIESGARGGPAALHRHPQPRPGAAPDPLPDGRQRGAACSSVPAPSAPVDVATQLEKLEGMLDRGSLTPEEFEAQKRKLLG